MDRTHKKRMDVVRLVSNIYYTEKNKLCARKNGVKSLLFEDTQRIGMEAMDRSDRKNTGRYGRTKKKNITRSRAPHFGYFVL